MIMVHSVSDRRPPVTGLPRPGGMLTTRGWFGFAIVLGWMGIAGYEMIASNANLEETNPASAPVVQWWLSSEDLQARLTPQPELRFRPGRASGKGILQVDDTTTYQSVLGLGSSLEHSTRYNLSLLPADRRESVIESLVHPERGIGINLMRICIGTSDFAPGPFYTYNDMPAGQEDPKLEHFSIERDREYVLPVLQAARRLNPRLRFFASPWTPPPWMKTNGRYGGGSLRRECYPYFAEYLARFIEAYHREGIEIHALTVQNEPEYRADYFIYGQFMKFIPRGAVRIAASESSRLPPNVAFKNPDGRLVLVVANAESKPRPFTVAWNDRAFTATLTAKSVATFRWAGRLTSSIGRRRHDPA